MVCENWLSNLYDFYGNIFWYNFKIKKSVKNLEDKLEYLVMRIFVCFVVKGIIFYLFIK